MVFYSMYATAFDPAVASIFSINPNLPVLLTSSRIYETGVKQLLWDNRAEWTFSAYDIVRKNVYQAQGGQVFNVAGEIAVQGIELAAAVRPIEGWKLWGNLAFTHARYVNFDFDGGSFTGNTPPNVAPIIANGGVSYRFQTGRGGRSSSAARCAMSATATCSTTTRSRWTPIRSRTPTCSWTSTSSPCSRRWKVRGSRSGREI